MNEIPETAGSDRRQRPAAAPRPGRLPASDHQALPDEESADRGSLPGSASPGTWLLCVPGRDRPVPAADPAVPGPPHHQPPPANAAVAATPARRGFPGAPAFTTSPAGNGERRETPTGTPWQRSLRRWGGPGAQWDRPVAAPAALAVPLGAPVAKDAGALVQAGPDGGGAYQGPGEFPEPYPDGAALEPDGGAAYQGPGEFPEPYPDGAALEPDGAQRREGHTLFLGPSRGPRWRPRGRRLLAAAAAAIALALVAALALTLLTGHNPQAGQLAAGQTGNPATASLSPLTLGMYAGQEQRGVTQALNRIVASGTTIVATGSQTSDGIVRQQFIVSADGGASWRLAPVGVPGGGPSPAGYAATRVAGGPGGWVAVGAQAIWTSPDGLSWTLAATHGITPMLPGDQMWVMTSTAQGFLAAGRTTGGGRTQAAIWTSRDGLSWQRKTAAQLRLARPGETVQSINYAASRGSDTVISGAIVKGRSAYSAVWLSTDGGSAWTRVTVPAGHGASNWITGLGFDGSGLIAVRTGRSARGAGEGVAYFSPTGQAWRYSATVRAPDSWSPSLVKGSQYGFVIAGTSAAGQILAYTSTGTGTAWRAAAPLGSAAGEIVDGATVGSARTVIVIGSAASSPAGQQPVFLEENTAGSIRSVSLAGVPGGTVPELAVNALAADGGQEVAAGSADGYPALWRKAPGGSWALALSQPQVSAYQGLRALTSVTHGSAGWLAVGAPGPVVFTSADGKAWQDAAGPGSITSDLAGVSAAAAAAGPAGYVIAGNLAGPGGTSVADVWWSRNLTSWTRAPDVNDAGGSNQVLAVAAGPHGFVAAGSHDGQPAVWITADGRSWTTIILPAPAGASSAVLQHVAVNGGRVVALGQETTAAGSVPFAELSVNGGAIWSQVPFSTPGPDAVVTALTARSGGFTAAGQAGEPGQVQVALWTSANGAAWTRPNVKGVTGAHAGGSYQVTALASSGPGVTGIGSVVTQQSQGAFVVTLPASGRP